MKDMIWGKFRGFLDHLKQLMALVVSLTAMSGTIWSFYAIDSSSIEADVSAIATGNKVFVEFITYKVPPLPATVYYKLDNVEVVHHHYEQLPDGKKVQMLDFPLEYHSEIRVDVVIELEGMRTLFKDKDIKYTKYVVTGG